MRHEVLRTDDVFKLSQGCSGCFVQSLILELTQLGFSGFFQSIFLHLESFILFPLHLSLYFDFHFLKSLLVNCSTLSLVLAYLFFNRGFRNLFCFRWSVLGLLGDISCLSLGCDWPCLQQISLFHCVSGNDRHLLEGRSRFVDISAT